MRTFNIIIGVTALVFSLVPAGCHSGTRQTEKIDEGYVEKGKVVVYYFHRNIRCVACRDIEYGAQKTLEEDYAGQQEKGLLSFRSVNLDDKRNEGLARRIHVNGQALVVVDHDRKKDLTNTAFLYATTHPEKYRAALKKAIDEMLHQP